MAHIPINHPLRPLYRALSGLVGAYVLLFGVLGFFMTRGTEFFGPHGEWVLGLRTNPAFSIMSILAGGVLLLSAVVGGNVFHYINVVGSVVFMVTGMAMMTLLQTDANILGFSMVTCIASFIFGLVTMAAGLYGKVGTTDQASAEEAFRHGEAVQS